VGEGVQLLRDLRHKWKNEDFECFFLNLKQPIWEGKDGPVARVARRFATSPVTLKFPFFHYF
jgi:hypothetical protein